MPRPKDFLAQWLAARKAETAPSTFNRYGEVTAKFLAFLGPKALAPLEDVSKAQIAGFPRRPGGRECLGDG